MHEVGPCWAGKKAASGAGCLKLRGLGTGWGEVRGDTRINTAKGLASHWRTLGIYSKRDGQPLEDTAKSNNMLFFKS